MYGTWDISKVLKHQFKGVVRSGSRKYFISLINYVFSYVLRNVTYHIHVHQFINMADIEMQPCWN